MEPYKYLIYNPLKGGEFEETMKKTAMNGVGHKRPTISTLPRFKETKDKYPARSTIAEADFQLTTERSTVYSFSRSKRSASLAPSSGANELRFSYNPREAYPNPLDFTRKKVVLSIDFGKCLPRDSKAFKCNIGSTTAEFKEKAQAAQVRCGIPFSKMLPRNSLPTHSLQVSAPDPHSINKILEKLSTQKRVLTPNFCYFKSRYKEGQKLPSFMESLNSRLAITTLSFEMLKANGYLAAKDKKPVYSSFGEKKLFNVQRPGTNQVSFNNYMPECLKTQRTRKKHLVFAANGECFLCATNACYCLSLIHICRCRRAI
eukprot:TRINITY_DN2511_c0_g2_i1.p1 TRINITY_DN2511_c0_g2~~TRINITY_DN2511_c0_g2_i1.p1  ORF type:complete len:316 (+),score=65.95 TRINITY_DN2511_c0_g2_i1:359-1306(+)